jgi:hypothetical protein
MPTLKEIFQRAKEKLSHVDGFIEFVAEDEDSLGRLSDGKIKFICHAIAAVQAEDIGQTEAEAWRLPIGDYRAAINKVASRISYTTTVSIWLTTHCPGAYKGVENAQVVRHMLLDELIAEAE